MLKLERSNMMRIKRLVVTTVVATLAVAALGVPSALSNHGGYPPPDDIPAGVEPVPTGPEFQIATGSIGSTSWTATVQETDGGICLTASFTPSGGATGGCGYPGVETEMVGFDEAQLHKESLVFVMGPVAKVIKVVELTLSDGTIVTTNTITGPVGYTMDFYVTAISSTASTVQIRGLDALGTALFVQQLPPIT